MGQDILNFTGKSKALILVYRSMEKVKVSQSVNVMLTPEFYTLKKEPLPVRYAYQAKRIAPSLFEGLLDGHKRYDYMVWKEDEQWVCIAYDLEMITAFLEQIGFNLEYVSKLFFAQQSASLFVAPLFLNSDKALISLEHDIAVVPQNVLGDQNSAPLEFDNSFTPKKGISLQSVYGSILSVKQTAVLASLFICLCVIFFIEGLRYGENSKVIESQMEELFEAYPSLSSQYTRESIVSKYKTIDTVERKKRNTIKNVSSMIFKGVTLNSLEMNEKRLRADFECKDAQVLKRVKALAKQKGFKTRNASGTNTLQIEGTL